MEKIRIKDLIEFRRKSDKSKKTFVSNLQKQKNAESGGGDYWISSLSTISNVFRSEKYELLEEKIDILHDKIRSTSDDRAKMMYQKNLDILHNFQEFDFQTLRPKTDLNFLKKPEENSILKINGLPIQIRPSHVFSFEVEGFNKIGAIWFIAKKDGFKTSELGLFAEALKEYLDKYYSKKFVIEGKYCIAVDVFNIKETNFLEIQQGDVPSLLKKTINSLKNLI